MKPKNTVPSAPEDLLDVGQVFTGDGRKRQDANFVGARSPDTDAAVEKPLPHRGKRAHSAHR